MKTTEKHEEKASEILARAAKLLNDAKKVYDANFELMKEQDALQQDLLHLSLIHIYTAFRGTWYWTALQRRPHQQNTTNGPSRPERTET